MIDSDWISRMEHRRRENGDLWGSAAIGFLLAAFMLLLFS